MTFDSVMLANLGGLGAALCWAVSGLIAIGPVRAIGSVAFNRVRLSIVFVLLAAAVTVLGGWETLTARDAALLALSGVVGIVMGDVALFWSLSRLGPRRNAVVYATNAPMTALLGWAALGEGFAVTTLAGIALVTAGVMLAVFYRAREPATHRWEAVQGGIGIGVAVCLVAALCQAAGSVIAKPAMADGTDPVAAAAVRVGTAAALLLAYGLRPSQRAGIAAALKPAVLGPVVVNGIIGIGLGMTLLMIGLAHGRAGVVATLSATSPVLILPLLWIVTRRPAAAGAWIGAGLAVAGVMLIVNR
ncbi:DMT family transporter [Azospirillum halopraeferens]|uniref:DMT family transporter n=1 Tax=Azospirillum halopraeferens TaxID=34010 RepID=UPI00040DC146|nr:DMT family transporter [Azospirillum halopraeferens]